MVVRFKLEIEQECYKMQRLPMLALMLSFTVATPGVAQTTADMSPESTHYGPPREPQDEARPKPPRDRYTMEDVAPAPASADESRMVAAEEIGPGMVLGLGLFRIIREPKRDAIDRKPVVRSRIAAAGLSMGF